MDGFKTKYPDWGKLANRLLGILISGLAIIWIVVKTDWPVVGEYLRQMNYALLVPLTVFVILNNVSRAWRWRYLLPPDCGSSLRQRFDALAIGGMATFVLPFRAGEFIRPLVFSRYTAISFSTGFISVVVERFFDLATVLILFALVVLRIPGLPVWVHAGGVALAITAGCIFLGMLTASFAPRFVQRAAAFFLKPLPARFNARAEHLINDFIRGADVLSDWRRLGMAFLSSAAVWGCSCLNFYVGFPLLGLEAAFLPAVTVVVIVALAIAAPSAPGFIGVYQTGCIVAFALFGMSKESAVAFSIVTHLHCFLLYVLYGSYVLARDNFGLTELAKEKQAA